MSEIMEAISELTEDEFLRLARVIYEHGVDKTFGNDPNLKRKLKTRIEEWLEI